MHKNIHAPQGNQISCKGWAQEAAMRMLMNNLDPEVAEDPDNLIVYGGTGKAARNWECYDAIIRNLKTLENDETLLIQSGKPVGRFRTFTHSPRVIIANSMLVPKWANWDYFRDLEQKGLMMYGQMTAGSWIYIGTQGILQGTYETFAAIADKHFNGSLKNKWIITGGLGGMGGAQPLAGAMNEAAILCIEVDKGRIQKRIDTGYLDVWTDNIDEALKLTFEARDNGKGLSVGLLGNCAEILPMLIKKNIIPDIITDQTSAHDELEGYVPHQIPYTNALSLRKSDPKEYIRLSMESMKIHCESIIKMQEMGSIAVDYGNNLRGQAEKAGLTNAFAYPGFVPAYIRPLFCEGKGPFRWAALSGDPEDIFKTDELIKREFPNNKPLNRWIDLAQKRIKFQGLPCRICWLGYKERDHIGKLMNQMVAKGELKAPLVLGRDHLDCGSVASPNRETESMLDGSDAIADWPILNALINTACGASWVSVHHGGGVGIGYSIHAGVVLVLDGTKEAEEKAVRVLTNDPGMGVIRHADAGYKEAIDFAEKKGVIIPLKA